MNTAQFVFAATFFSGCAAMGGGAQAALKAPVTSRCEKVGLDGCPDIVTGAIAYAEGDQLGGEEALRRGLAANLDKAVQLEQFANALELLGKVPGAGQYVQPLQPAIAIIQEAARAGKAAPTALPSAAPPALAATPPAPAPSASAEENEPLPAVDGAGVVPPKSVAGGNRATVTEAKFLLVGSPGTGCPAVLPPQTVCVSQGFAGKTQVAQVIVSPACPGEVVISAGTPRMQPRWLLWVPAGRGLDLRDVDLPLTRYDAITVGVLGVTPLPDARCGVNVLLR